MNPYICARNPMLYLRAGRHLELCVLRVGTAALDIPGTVIADQNAASDYVRFGSSPGGLSNVDEERVFAEFWTHPEDKIEGWRHKSIKCAEVLVPQGVPWNLVLGAYVSCEAKRERIRIPTKGRVALR